MLPSVYIETTIPSYLAAWPSSDLVRAAHQKITKDWWLIQKGKFDIFISQFVWDEASAGDVAAANDRVAVLQEIPFLAVTEEALFLTDSIIQAISLPQRATKDAAHIAVAAVHRMDFLLTWNCTHINNAQLLPRIEQACRASGFAAPVICTPEELMGI